MTGLTAAVVPMKRLGIAKGRLQGALDAQTRAALAAAMLADVLDALGRCRLVGATILVSADAAAASAGRARGVEVLVDPREEGQSAAAQQGIAHVAAAGGAAVLCVPGDCPALDEAELEALIEGAPTGAEEHRAGPESARVVIVPDRHGTGTNALLLRPPTAIAPSFGPGSFARHLALARSAGVAAQVVRPKSLLLDVDSAEDLAALRAHLMSAPRTVARHTRALLDRTDIAAADRAADGAAPGARAVSSWPS